MATMKMYDWQNREYEVEIVYTRLASDVSGYIVHVDDDPFLEGEMYPTRDAALQAIRDHFAGCGWPPRLAT